VEWPKQYSVVRVIQSIAGASLLAAGGNALFRACDIVIDNANHSH
jgi:hypothetical protein